VARIDDHEDLGMAEAETVEARAVAQLADEAHVGLVVQDRLLHGARVAELHGDVHLRVAPVELVRTRTTCRDPTAAMRRCPTRRPLVSFRNSTDSWKLAIVFCVMAKSARPLSVSCTPRPRPAEELDAVGFLERLHLVVMVGWLMFSRREAPMKLPVSATAWKERIWTRFIGGLYRMPLKIEFVV
jgi:hypothetical protein